MPANLRPSERLANFEEAFDEMIASSSDEELEEIVADDDLDDGADPVAEAERVRRVLLQERNSK